MSQRNIFPMIVGRQSLSEFLGLLETLGVTEIKLNLNPGGEFFYRAYVDLSKFSDEEARQIRRKLKDSAIFFI